MIVVKVAPRGKLNKIGTLIVLRGSMKNTEKICLLARSKFIHSYVNITH